MLKKIFLIQDYGETHYKITILGIIIKFPKPKYAKLKKENIFYYYKKHNIDIRTIPPATGKLRELQLANVVLLKELDYVCKQANLKYWLDGGTLLGAVRHKGYIPWDDDIDTGMLREDYNKIVEAFEKYSRDPDIYAGFVRDKSNNLIIKIQHKKCPCLFVDIFPFDFYGKSLTTDEQLRISKKIKNIRNNLSLILAAQTSIINLQKILSEKIQNEILSNNSNNNCISDLVWGIDFNQPYENWFTEYDVIFPLKPILFEGEYFPSMNKPDCFLKRLYKDYLSYPKRITMGHSIYKEFTEAEKDLIKSLIKNNNIQE